MGLELQTVTDPVKCAHGFVCIGEHFHLTINPEHVTKMEPSPVRDADGAIRAVEVVIHYQDGREADRVAVLRFADLLRAMESAIQWRRTWPKG